MTIRLFLLLDSYSGLGEAIANDLSIQIKPPLISAMIAAIQAYISEGLKQHSQYTQLILGNWRIIVIPAPELGKHIEFVIFQDIWDSLEYTHLKAQMVARLVKPFFSSNRRIPKEIFPKVRNIATFTQKFPIGVVTKKIDETTIKKIKKLIFFLSVKL